MRIVYIYCITIKTFKMKKIVSLLSCQKRKVILTGATGYLGKEISKILASIGFDLVLVDLNYENLNKLSLEIKNEFDVEVKLYCCNLEKEAERNELIKSIKKDFSEINCLINNAAFVGTTDLDGWNVPFEEQNLSSWRKAFEVNLTAPFHLSQAISEIMINAQNPNIINVGSIYGHYGPDWNLYKDTEINNIAAYSASKGGLIQLTKWLSTTLSPKIRVNAISPGGIFRGQNQLFVDRYSSKVPLKRMANEDDFLGGFVFLASDMSLYVTGQILKIDGGWGLS